MMEVDPSFATLSFEGILKTEWKIGKVQNKIN
jgi:hypothetical protein